MLDLKLDNALQARLAHGQDASCADVLSQQHAEIGGRKRAGLVLLGEIDQGEAGVSRYQQPQILPVILYGKQKFVFFRLGDLVDLAAFQFFF
jgi:hypothetical protein